MAALGLLEGESRREVKISFAQLTGWPAAVAPCMMHSPPHCLILMTKSSHSEALSTDMWAPITTWRTTAVELQALT